MVKKTKPKKANVVIVMKESTLQGKRHEQRERRVFCNNKTIHQEDLIIMSMYAFNNGVSKYIK